MMQLAVAAFTLVSLAAAQNTPAILAEGTIVMVDGTDFEVRPFGADPISIVDLKATISTIVAESADHEIEASQMSTQLSAMSTQMAALNRSLLNTIGQQAARITAAEIRMRENEIETSTEISGIVSSIATLATGAELAALSTLTARLRHPTRVVVDGPFVQGDDRPSGASCPEGQGLAPESCEVERMPGDVTGPFATDGVEMRPDGCTARAHVRGARIRSKLTCSDVHAQTRVVADPQYRTLNGATSLSIDCPTGWRALHCQCYSPWGMCAGDSWGFTPNSAVPGRCTSTRSSSSGRMKLSAICVNNA